VIRVAALGDSITSGSPGFDPDPAQRAALGFGHDERSQYEYWAHQTDPSLEFSNCGVYGERTDEIAMRLEDCADGADVLIVGGGINDIAQNASIEAAAKNLRSMVARGRELGLRVYLVDVLPWNNGHPQFDDQIDELNRMIAAIGREEGVTAIGFHDALEDPRQAGVMPIALTADGDHPSVAGYRRLGELVARELAN
jgi:lysophospholipase L1-like esterase